MIEDSERSAQNAEGTNNTNYSVIEEMKNAPFSMVEGERGWFAVMGKYRLTEGERTKDELVDYIESKPYEIIMRVTYAMLQELKEELKK